MSIFLIHSSSIKHNIKSKSEKMKHHKYQ
ncbi:hypothetical protein Pint_03853 [Pistacia integerrima]|uniref:Uncharacterized protein n=1 Tax=Pistacia integerrima TaxID=434235 RepID=A0ACC0ZAM9_9ROSI|nr:hypothetical protein Pint_03853 [Pistacia integerrima]